jgi:AcrR family transcriptional regulator
VLDQATERRMLLDAGLRVLRRTSFDRATLDEVLAESGLSTRAFYRQFSSITALLAELRNEENQRVVSRLEKLITGADGPIAALEACIDELLAIGYDARRARRAAMMRSNSVAGLEARYNCLEMFSGPIQRVLEAGREEGTFPYATPEADARTIFVVVFEFISNPTERQRLTYDEARAHVLRFALGALRYFAPGDTRT